MKINWKVRFKNPMFYVQLFISVFVPILAYLGLNASDVTTWAKFGEILLKGISNPYVLSLVFVSAYNSLIDPTTRGIGDSEQALTYDKPKK